MDVVVMDDMEEVISLIMLSMAHYAGAATGALVGINTVNQNRQQGHYDSTA
jgi:hypothetical protein